VRHLRHFAAGRSPRRSAARAPNAGVTRRAAAYRHFATKAGASAARFLRAISRRPAGRDFGIRFRETRRTRRRGQTRATRNLARLSIDPSVERNLETIALDEKRFSRTSADNEIESLDLSFARLIASLTRD